MRLVSVVSNEYDRKAIGWVLLIFFCFKSTTPSFSLPFIVIVFSVFIKCDVAQSRKVQLGLRCWVQLLPEELAMMTLGVRVIESVSTSRQDFLNEEIQILQRGCQIVGLPWSSERPIAECSLFLACIFVLEFNTCIRVKSILSISGFNVIIHALNHNMINFIEKWSQIKFNYTRTKLICNLVTRNKLRISQKLNIPFLNARHVLDKYLSKGILQPQLALRCIKLLQQTMFGSMAALSLRVFANWTSKPNFYNLLQHHFVLILVNYAGHIPQIMHTG